MIYTDERSANNIGEKHRPNLQALSKQFSTLTSTYTQAINKQQGRKGSLWSHATKAKILSRKIYLGNKAFIKRDLLYTCFNYIHQNPVVANLVENINNWEFSSFLDFNGKRNGSLINKSFAYEIINFDKDNFQKQSLIALDENILKCIY